MNALKTDLKEALELKPMRPELVERVVALPPRRQHIWVGWASAAAAACGVAAVVFLLAAPRVALADLILREAQRVHGHIMTYRIDPGGKRTLTSESWGEGGLSRSWNTFSGRETEEFVDANKDRAATWNPSVPYLSFVDHGVRNHSDFAQAVASGDLTSMVNRFKPYQSGPVKTGRTTFEGHPAEYVQVEAKLPHQRIQETFYADPADHHILGTRGTVWNDSHIQALARGKHPMIRIDGVAAPRQDSMSIVDTGAVSPQKLEPVFRIDGKDVDVFQERDAITARLTQADLATCRLGAGTIRVRDFSRNADGDIFVLFTAGKEPPMLGFSADDGVGGRYKMWDVSRPDDKTLEIDGEPLQGGWLVHGSGPALRGPIRLKFWLNGTGHADTAEVSLTPTATTRPLPFYSLYVNVAGFLDFQRERTETLAELLMGNRQYGPAIPVLRKAIAALVASGDESAWMREELGHALSMVHRYPESIKEFTQAEKVAEGMNPGQAERIKGEILATQKLAGAR